MKIKKFKNSKIYENSRHLTISKIEISSESGKSFIVDKDDIKLLLDRGYIWQDDNNYSFHDKDHWAIRQMIKGIGMDEKKINEDITPFDDFDFKMDINELDDEFVEIINNMPDEEYKEYADRLRKSAINKYKNGKLHELDEEEFGILWKDASNNNLN